MTAHVGGPSRANEKKGYSKMRWAPGLDLQKNWVGRL